MMSYRILFSPACFEGGSQCGADVVIPIDATDEQIGELAALWAWRLPLKVWTPSLCDCRYLLFKETLADAHLQEIDEDTQVYVAPPIVKE